MPAAGSVLIPSWRASSVVAPRSPPDPARSPARLRFPVVPPHPLLNGAAGDARSCSPLSAARALACCVTVLDEAEPEVLTSRQLRSRLPPCSRRGALSATLLRRSGCRVSAAVLAACVGSASSLSVASCHDRTRCRCCRASSKLRCEVPGSPRPNRGRRGSEVKAERRPPCSGKDLAGTLLL